MPNNLRLGFFIADVKQLSECCRNSLAFYNKRQSELSTGWQSGESAGRAAAYTLVADWLDEIISRDETKETTP